MGKVIVDLCRGMSIPAALKVVSLAPEVGEIPSGEQRPQDSPTPWSRGFDRNAPHNLRCKPFVQAHEPPPHPASTRIGTVARGLRVENTRKAGRLFGRGTCQDSLASFSMIWFTDIANASISCFSVLTIANVIESGRCGQPGIGSVPSTSRCSDPAFRPDDTEARLRTTIILNVVHNTTAKQGIPYKREFILRQADRSRRFSGQSSRQENKVFFQACRTATLDGD